MPIEIKELHIRVAVNNAKNDASNAKQTLAGTRSGIKQEDRSAIIAECVEQVMQVLKQMSER